MLNLIRCEFWKLKRKMFVQLVLAASFLFPIPLTAIIYYLNTAQNKYATKAAAFDALWQSVIGFGMLLLLPCILGIVAALLFFMERDNDTFKNLRTIPITSSQMRSLWVCAESHPCAKQHRVFPLYQTDGK